LEYSEAVCTKEAVSHPRELKCHGDVKRVGQKRHALAGRTAHPPLQGAQKDKRVHFFERLQGFEVGAKKKMNHDMTTF
jgi:hypothetical protein